MANLRQAKTDDEVKKLTVNNVKCAYHDLAIDYNHLLDLDYIYCPHCGKWKSTKGNGNFYKSSKSKSGFEHFACKACILDLCTDVDPKTGIRTDNTLLDSLIGNLAKVIITHNYKLLMKVLVKKFVERLFKILL